MLEPDNKLLVSHRRLFAQDEQRYFVGWVVDYADGLAKVGGYTFQRDVMSGGFVRKDDLRVKILPLTSSGLIVYQLPDSVDVETVRFETENGTVVLTDGRHLRMDLSEKQRPHELP